MELHYIPEFIHLDSRASFFKKLQGKKDQQEEANKVRDSIPLIHVFFRVLKVVGCHRILKSLERSG